MRNLLIGKKYQVANLKDFYNMGQQSLINILKERISGWFIAFSLVNLLVVLLQASGVLPITYRGLVGILEIGLSIFLSYRFGYLGMLQSIFTNTWAAIHLFRLSTLVHTYFIMDSVNITERIEEMADSSSGMLFVNACTRIAIIIVSVFVAFSSERERKHIKRLEWLAYIDAVTGVYNHRYFQTKLEEGIKEIEGTNGSLSLIMIDLDNFKKYNDTNGHKAGDLLLSKTAEVILKEVGKKDVVCRYGGDKFAVITNESNPENILSLIERIRKAYNDMVTSEEFDRITDSATLSVGYSIYPALARNKDELIMQSDSALYQAKNLGRNNVQLYRNVFEEIKTFFSSDEHQLFGGLRALLGTVSAKDKYTLGHSERVMDYAVMIGRAMGLSNENLRLLKIAALLHDIGKVEIPESVLNKTEPLTQSEIEILRKHPSYSVDILEPLASIELLIDSIKYHHERYDGNGYPSGIKGKSIPLGARILCVADAFDAMLSDRPYRKGMRMDQVIAELKKNSGTQFDPDTVNAFLSTLSVS
ncbi:MAG TPA: diguanylate cyclase [Acetivibrio sp.]|nr:diguanylate cyclase [Acetivibrio sp.]HPT91034.1 diguanylate cyclase [Acetivibrio sp.]HQA57218.1 diguanylate cyclase [Acetivibrio sp.]